jgi:predicted nucleotidyltransferase
VRRLELFGSAARGVGEPRDLDFLVGFEPLPPGQRAPAYFGLPRELEALFGRPVDLVMAKRSATGASSPRSRASGQ